MKTLTNRHYQKYNINSKQLSHNRFPSMFHLALRSPLLSSASQQVAVMDHQKQDIYKNMITLSPQSSMDSYSDPSQQQREVETRAMACTLSLFLQNVCPVDLIPKIMSFAGHEAVRNLSCCSKEWKSMMEFEGLVWKTLCTDTYKWSEGDEVPSCWKNHYDLNPSIPLDYSTISKAIDTTISSFVPHQNDNSDKNPNTKIRILVHPGKYTLNKSLVIQPPNNVDLTIESLPIPQDVKHVPYLEQVDPQEDCTSTSKISSRRFKKREKKLANFLKKILHRRSSSRPSAHDDERLVEHHQHHVIENGHESDTDDEESVNRNTNNVSPSEICPANTATHRQATLTINHNTSQNNRPILDVRQGNLKLINIKLDHYSSGNNIWVGNAAIHIQPYPMKHDTNNTAAIVASPPHVICDTVDIQSASGRGINLFGGFSGTEEPSERTTTDTTSPSAKVEIYSSYIHHCAATGLYVGEGERHEIHIDNSDVMYNGHGSRRRRHHQQQQENHVRGIGIRGGHSGICLQGGNVKVARCNISHNASAAILGLGNTPISLNVSSSHLLVTPSSIASPVDMTPASEVTLSDDNIMSTSTTSLSNNNLDNDENQNDNNMDEETFQRLRSSLATAVARPSMRVQYQS